MKVICIPVGLLLLSVFSRAQELNRLFTLRNTVQAESGPPVNVLQQPGNINNISRTRQMARVINIKDFMLAKDSAVTADGVADQIETKQSGKLKWQTDDSIGNSKKNSWLKFAIAIGYCGATYLCYKLLDTKIQKISQGNKNGFQTFISNSVTGLGLGEFHAIAWGSTTAIAFATKNKRLQQTVIIWAGSLLINSVLTDQLKISFQRHRPNSGDPYNSFDWRKGPKLHTSFPSAHTSNAFTTATVFATQYKTKKWVPPVAYTLASLVGLSRIYDNAHWTSDVLAGAAIGFLSAKVMNTFYKMAKKKLVFLPQVSASCASINLVYQF